MPTHQTIKQYVEQLRGESMQQYPDTVGNSSPAEINLLFSQLQQALKFDPAAIGWVATESIDLALNELNAEQLSLRPGRKQCSITVGPYFDTGFAGVELCKSYRGLRDAAVRAGKINSARPVLVYEADRFDWKDSFTVPEHSYNPFDKQRGQIIGAYCVAEMPSGSLVVTHFTIDELMQTYWHQQVAGQAWDQFFIGMLLAKTVRLSEKYWS